MLVHFPTVPYGFVGEVTINTQRQGYEFVDKSCAELDLSFVIYDDNHNKYYYFTDTAELRLVPLSTFPFATRFVL